MSDEETTNICTAPLRFPLHPGDDRLASRAGDCSCCGPAERVGANNRPALPRFNYRIGTYSSIREYLLARINLKENLRGWTHREPDDPAVALLEGAAILGDILTFYQETYANEAFLRTARWRESVSDLVRLLGYRLSPAVGGSATFAIEVKKEDPITVRAGFPIKATLEGKEKPSEFETKKEIIAYPWLSRFNLFRPLDPSRITSQTTEFYISRPEQLSIEVKGGDRLMIGEAAGFPNNPQSLENAEIVIIDSVREQHGTKIYRIKGSLKPGRNTDKLVCYRLGRTFHHFGHNSPGKIVDVSKPVYSEAKVVGQTTTTISVIPYQGVLINRPVNGDTASPTIKPILRDIEFPIDMEVSDLAVNTPFIIQAKYRSKRTFTPKFRSDYRFAVRTIAGVRPLPVTWGGVSGTVSVLTLSNSLAAPGDQTLKMRITDALFHEAASPLMEIRATGTEAAASGTTLNFFGTEAQAKNLLDRSLMFEIAGAGPDFVTVKEVPALSDAEFPMLRTIRLSSEVDYAKFPNVGPVATVYGNLVEADEGRTLPEAVIGSGDRTSIFQNFKLPKPPLTYHIVTENTPPETPETDIYVDGRLWTQVDSFFGRGADEQIYIVREDTEGNSWVQFGDGKTGARPNTGVDNITSVHRTGTGAYGALEADTKVDAAERVRNLDKILLVGEVSGGSGPEDAENARSAAPGKVQGLGRIVSLKDMEMEAAALPGVVLASAAWRLKDGVPAAAVTVLMETGRGGEYAAVRDTLNSYNQQRGAARDRIEVELGGRKFVTLTLQCVLKPTFRADLVGPEIYRALGVNYGAGTDSEDRGGLFSSRLRRFGQSEYVASIEGIAQNVDGVLWAKTVTFAGIGVADDPVSLNRVQSVLPASVVTCGRDQILSLYDQDFVLVFTAGDEN